MNPSKKLVLNQETLLTLARWPMGSGPGTGAPIGTRTVSCVSTK